MVVAPLQVHKQESGIVPLMCILAWLLKQVLFYFLHDDSQPLVKPSTFKKGLIYFHGPAITNGVTCEGRVNFLITFF